MKCIVPGSLRVYSLFAAVLFLLAAFPPVAFAADWSLTIGSVETKDELHTTQYNTNYDGSVSTIDYDNVPSSGNVYAIVSVTVSKGSSSAAALDVSSLKLVVDGVSYSAVTPVASFLGNHNYSTFTGESVLASSTGSVAFEVPESYLDDTGDGWYVSVGEYSSAAYDSSNIEVTYGQDTVTSQAEIEQQILDDYEAQGKASVASPFIVQDVYGNSPLTALVMFETGTATAVNVTIHGKDSSGDISYEVSGEETHHEVPIIGLYAGYTNKVTITAGSESVTVEITTEALPDSVETISKTASDGAQQVGQLFLLQSAHQIAFDNNGDVRWYLPEEWSSKTTSSDANYPMMVASDGQSFWYFRNPLTNWIYDEGDELVHMTWLGKVESIISNPDLQSDHDCALIDDNTMLYIHGGDVNVSSTGAAIYAVDLTTGESSEWLAINDILDPTVDPSEPNTFNDPWHFNTIEYVDEDNSIVISLRNQSMVLKINCDTKKVDWVLTPASGTNDDGSTWARQTVVSDLVVLPAADDETFEWFYEQHAPTVVSYDSTSGEMILGLFDNGNSRYNHGDYPNAEQYSRMVYYKIDENTKTVSQVYSYGEERGSELYSNWYGSTQYVESTGNYVANFAKYNGANNSHIVEADDQGSVVAEYQIDGTSNGSYRVTMLEAGRSYSNVDLGGTVGSEIHLYSQDYWTSDTLGDPSEMASLVLSAFYKDGDSLFISGSAYTQSSVAGESFKLVAAGSSGTYSFDLLACGTAGLFYGLGIPTDSLGDDTYSLYLEVVDANGSTVVCSLGRTLTIGDADTASISVNLPDDTQESIMETLTEEAAQSTFENMTVQQDPFGMSPLTAMALFSTEDLCSVTVTSHGKNDACDVTYEVEGSRLLHEIPIVGLYYNDTTLVTITLTHADGTQETKELSLTTGEAPNTSKIPTITCEYDEDGLNELAPGLTFCAPSYGSYYYAVDLCGDIRWYYAYSGNIGIDGVSITSDDHIVILDGDTTASAETNSYGAQEIDLLGRVYKEYFLENMSFHHELKELENGNLICAATDYTKDTINDVVVEFDSDTGEIVNRWDLDEILAKYGIDRIANPSYGLTELTDDNGEAYNANWFHNNCVYYDESEGTLLLSSRHQNAVFKINAKTSEIIWILTDHTIYEGTDLEQYLLDPVDSEGNAISNDEFEWQYGQHAPSVLENGDIAIFDNGNYRSKLAGGTSAEENYSRIVVYHIDEGNRTVSQVSEFGEEYGDEHYCALIGDVDELGSNHYLGTFGGHCKTSADGQTTDSYYYYIMASLFEVKDGEVVWSLTATPTSPTKSAAIYRSERVDLTSIAYTYDSTSGESWIGDPSLYLSKATNLEVDYGSTKTFAAEIQGASTMNLSDSQTLSLIASPSNAVVGASWSSSNESVLSIDSSTGVVKAVGPGVAVVTAESSDNGTRAQLVITVKGTQLSQSELAMRMDDSVALSLVSVTDSESSSVTWSSSDEAIATVDENGLVSGKESGEVVITATVDGVKYNCTVTVSQGLDDGVYTIASKLDSTMVLDIAGASNADSANVQLYKDNNTTAQQFRVTYQGDGIYEIAALCSDKVLDAAGGGTTSGTNVQQYSSNGTAAQKWMLQDAGDGYFYIIGFGSGLAVDVTSASTANGTNIQLYSKNGTNAQKFAFVQRFEEGVYRIASSLDTSKVLDVSAGSTAAGGNIQLYSSNRSAAQTFLITYASEGAYSITPLCSGLVMDLSGAGNYNGANVQQYTDNGSAAQRWYIKQNDDGTYSFVSASSGRCLDVASGSTANGTNVQTWELNGSEAQKFKLISASTTKTIVSALDSSYALDIEAGSTASGANVQLYKRNGTAAQSFYVTNSLTGGARYIIPVGARNALDVQNGATYAGANVWQYSLNASAAQRWYLEYTGSSQYRIRSALSGLCLDVSAGRAANGSNIQVWDSNNTAAQRFVLD